MSRPLHRGVPVGRSIENTRDSWDSQMKDRSDKDDTEKSSSPFRSLVNLVFQETPCSSKSSSNENGYGSDHLNSSQTSRNRGSLTLSILKLSLIVVVVFAVSGSLWWTISISTTSRSNIFRGHRRLQEQLLTDLSDIGALSIGSSKLKELEFCGQEYENYVPCFNSSRDFDSSESYNRDVERECVHGSSLGCLIAPPMNYKVPLRWPTGKNLIWANNVKITAQEVLTSGSLTKRMMMLGEDQISFRFDSFMSNGVEDYSHQIAEMIGLRNESNFIQAGVRTVLDIGCGYGSFGAHLFSKQLLTMCVANYELSGSQVQLNLERGLPALIGSFTSRQLPFPSLSFDMLHCSRCGINWDEKDGIFLVEADRLLKPGGYFVWTSPLTNSQGTRRNKENMKKWIFIHDFVESLCWELLAQEDETVVWKKTSKRDCYALRKSGEGLSICSKAHDVESPYYLPLHGCIRGTRSRRWFPIEERTSWPSRAILKASELEIYGVNPDDFTEDSIQWNSMVRNYWSLLSPLIFSDHPKRPGDEEPPAPFNMLRNVLDMNAHFGGLNAALVNAGKTVWVMNVVPVNAPNTLPLILDRGYVGVLHDWCEAFPTYPRTYDMIHAEGLLSFEAKQKRRCTTLDLFLEIDRILRPEGWVILRDATPLIEATRVLAAQVRWEARMVEIESNNDEKLLVCQKPFMKKQLS